MFMDSFKAQAEVSGLLSTLDWVFFFLVLALTFLAIAYGQHLKNKASLKEEQSFLDLLVLGRRLTLPMFIATLVATWYGGIFGVTQIAFNQGVYNFITQGVFWYITYIIFALFIVNKISKFKALTLPDLIGQMFGKKSSYISAVFNFFNVVPVVYTISLGVLLQLLFGGELWAMTLIGVGVVICYSFFGGLRAVVFSDVVQFFVMCLGVLLVLIFSVKTFGGLDFLKANLPESHFALTGKNSLGTTFAWGLVALSTLVDPNFYQRCFAAKSPRVAKRGILLSTIVWVCFDICTTAGAMYARAIIPEASSNEAYLLYSLQLLPPGFKGIFLAGILATILSTMDSYLFIAGSTIAHDLLPKNWKHKEKIHYIAVALTGLLATALSFSFQGDIKAVWKTLGSYSAACLLFPVLMGYIFPKKFGDRDFVVGCVLGVIVVTFWRNAQLPAPWGELDELYAGVLASLVGMLFSYYTSARKGIHRR
jgi:SSS family solute:Na+ symporter